MTRNKAVNLKHNWYYFSEIDNSEKKKTHLNQFQMCFYKKSNYYLNLKNSLGIIYLANS